MKDAVAIPLLAQETGRDAGSAATPVHTENSATSARPRGKLLWVLLALLFGVGAGGWLFGPHKDNREELPPAAAGAVDASAIAVTVEPVQFRPVRRTVEAVGTLHGFEEVSLSAKVEGRVRSVHHDMADRVKPGELLIRLDPTDYELSAQQAEKGLQVELAKLGLKEPPAPNFDLAHVPTVEQAHARLENAQAKLERQRRLLTSRAVSAEEFDNITSDFRSAQAEFANQQLIARAGLATIQLKQTMLAVAGQQVKDSEIFAPAPSQPVPGTTAGVTYAMTQRMVSEGTYVKSGTEVCRLVLDQTLKLRVPVPERFSAEIKEGQQVDVTSAAFAEPFVGKLTRVNPSVDPRTRTFDVEIQIPNPERKLKPGGFARAAIYTREDKRAPTVPLAAISTFAGVTKVFLAEHGRARAVPVRLGVQTTEWAEIASPDLPEHAEVITSGQLLLATKTPITVREPASDARTSPPAPSTDARRETHAK
jgi:membrane fusion protein (multidrug efflux system)